MGVFFNPPPVGGPVPFNPTFSEFFLCGVDHVDAPTLERLVVGLRRRDFTPSSTDSGNAVRILAASRIEDQVLAELEALKADGSGPILVVLLKGRERSPNPWEVMAAGADDVLPWDGSDDALDAIVARLGRWREIQNAVESLRGQGVVVGASPVWRRALSQLVEAAKFASAPVLIVGESGTGKELLARSVHVLDPRPEKGELVLVDGATLNPELAGSELFGHEKGAFTGAASSREGALALAHRGTLFVDEVGEIAVGVQGDLLRALQDGTYKPVGGNHWKQSCFRLVCATNRDLDRAMEEGSFRQDLFFRLAGCRCDVPPLRERREDIPFLVERFLKEWRPDRPPRLDQAVTDFLIDREYPGNVRELKQVVNRLLSRYPGHGPLTVATIPDLERPLVAGRLEAREGNAFATAVHAALGRGKGLEEIRRTATRTAYSIVLSEEGGDTARAAKRLNVSKRAVQMFVKESSGD